MEGSLNDFMYLAFAIEGYKATDQATKAADSDIYYYGFVNKLGAWYIMQHDTSAGANNLQTFRFIKGDSAYTTAWTARESQSYDYFNTIFK